MSPLLLASLLDKALTYGPTAIAIVSKIHADISAGRSQTSVTPEDLAELARLSGLNSKEIYARLGISLPPATA